MMRRRFAVVAILACALATAAAPGVASARKIEKAFWGPAQRDGVSLFPAYQDLGVRIVQLQVNWAQTAPTRPQDPTNPDDPAYHWPADADFITQQAPQYGMRPLLMVERTPEWANGGQANTFLPTDTADYTNFLIALSRRYPGVHLWMIWGEACSHSHITPITPQGFGEPLPPDVRRQPQGYAQLLDAAYGTLKSVSRSNTVIVGNTWAVCDIRPIDWAHYLRMPNGRRPRMDLWGHNPYIVYDPSKVRPAWKVSDIYHLPDLQKAIDHYFGRPRGHRIGLYLSEFTMPTAPDQEFPVHASEGGQAQIINQAFRISRKLGTVSAIGWLYLYDTPPGPGESEGHYGGLIRPDGSLKPAYAAFKRQ